MHGVDLSALVIQPFNQVDGAIFAAGRPPERKRLRVIERDAQGNARENYELMSKRQEFMGCKVNLGLLNPAGELKLLSAIADTGASNSIVNRKFFRKYLENTVNVISVERFDDPLNLAAANNGALRIDESATIRVFITKQTSLDLPVYVAHTLSVDLILGNDFMNDTGAAIDFNADKVYLTNLNVHLPIIKDK